MSDWSVADLRAVTDHLARFDAGASFIDTAFPRHRLRYATDVARWLLPQPATLPEAERFLAGFACNARERSGPELGELAGSLRAAGRSPWVYIAEEDIVRWGPVAAQLGLPGLTAVSGEVGYATLMQAPWAGQMRWMRFTDREDGRRLDYAAWLPAESAEDLAFPTPPDFVDLAVDIDREAEPIIEKARGLLSDCPWQAEGDDDYSWQWTGPGVTHRICLGDPPREFRRLGVHFLDHPAHEGIEDNLMFQINGRHIAAQTDALGEIGGIAHIDLPEAGARPLVLGICAFPNALRIPGEPRHLRACMTEIEVMT